jgi:hypothetical protein
VNVGLKGPLVKAVTTPVLLIPSSSITVIPLSVTENVTLSPVAAESITMDDEGANEATILDTPVQLDAVTRVVSATAAVSVPPPTVSETIGSQVFPGSKLFSVSVKLVKGPFKTAVPMELDRYVPAKEPALSSYSPLNPKVFPITMYAWL